MGTRIDFLRHGEPVGGSKYRGYSIDDRLTEKGWEQMKRGVGQGDDWDIILTSPRIRCQAFAEWLGERNSIPVIVIDDLKEVGFGKWEGKTKAQLRESRPEEFDLFYTDPISNTPEGAEPLRMFYQRIEKVLSDNLKKYSGKNLLIVGHAGVIRAGIVSVIEADLALMYKLEIKNGCISRCRVTEKKTTLEGINICLSE